MQTARKLVKDPGTAKTRKSKKAEFACGLNTDGKFTLSVIPFINLLVIPAQL